MKMKRLLPGLWCPQPERIKVTRTRPSDRVWVPLIASALILSLLAMSSIQMWTPSAVNAMYPTNYGTFAAVQPLTEQPAQTTPAPSIVTSVSTDHFTVEFTFPASADPGNTITISAVTSAKANGRADSLSIDVFVYVNQQLSKTASATILSNKQVYTGNTWQSALTVAIPSNAVRSEMTGTVTEVWEDTTYNNAYYYSDYWMYSPYYYPYYYPPYADNYTIYYLYQPSYSYATVQKTSQQTLPLTYVLATTPEFEQLSAQHKALQQEYDSLVAQHNELTSQYNSLKSNYDQLTSQYNQLQTEHQAATVQLNNYMTYTYVLIVVAIVLGVLVALLTLQRRRAPQQPATEPAKKKEK